MKSTVIARSAYKFITYYDRQKILYWQRMAMKVNGNTIGKTTPSVFIVDSLLDLSKLRMKEFAHVSTNS